MLMEKRYISYRKNKQKNSNISWGYIDITKKCILYFLPIKATTIKGIDGNGEGRQFN